MKTVKVSFVLDIETQRYANGMYWPRIDAAKFPTGTVIGTSFSTDVHYYFRTSNASDILTFEIPKHIVEDASRFSLNCVHQYIDLEYEVDANGNYADMYLNKVENGKKYYYIRPTSSLFAGTEPAYNYSIRTDVTLNHTPTSKKDVLSMFKLPGFKEYNLKTYHSNELSKEQFKKYKEKLELDYPGIKCRAVGRVFHSKTIYSFAVLLDCRWVYIICTPDGWEIWLRNSPHSQFFCDKGVIRYNGHNWSDSKLGNRGINTITQFDLRIARFSKVNQVLKYIRKELA